MTSNYFVSIEKAYEEQGKYYVQGIASGLEIDRDEQKMGIQVLKDFASNLPLPLTNGHPKGGPVGGDLGRVVEATVLDDSNHSLFVKAELDMDNPDSLYLVKKVAKGGKFAFSIEGLKVLARPTWSDKLKKNITEFVKIIPTGISVTTKPSYAPSFLDVVTKSYQSDNLILNNSIMNEVNVDKEKELVQTEVETEVKTETAEEVKEETTQESNSTETQKTETAEVEKSEVEKSADMTMMKSLYKSMSDCVSIMSAMGYGDQEMVEECDDMMKSKEEDKDIVTKSYVDDAISGLHKSIEEFTAIAKSLHADVEAIKDLPLQKKSRVKNLDAVEKSFDDRKYSTIQDPQKRFSAKYQDLISAN